MKLKIIIFIVLIFSSLLINNTFSANCDIDPSEEMNYSIAIKDCLSDSDLVATATNPDLEVTGTGFKELILEWIQALSIFLAVGAVFGIAYGSLLLTLSGGEDERIKKGKDLIKWSILGFIAVAFAGTLISIVINFIYSL